MNTVVIVTKNHFMFYAEMPNEEKAKTLFNYFVKLQCKRQPFIFTIGDGKDKTVKSIPEHQVVTVNRTAVTFKPGLKVFPILDINLNLENKL